MTDADDELAMSLSIAIVGMQGRFPGAPDVDAFWRNVSTGVESVSTFTDEEYLAAGGDPGGLDDPYLVKAEAAVDGIDSFDAAFFGYQPAEAQLLDPQQRLFLECAHHALERAGHDPGAFDGAIGVYAGTGLNKYLLFNVLPNLSSGDAIGLLPALFGNAHSSLATRTSYELDLTGPSVAVQTSCSTSLTAVHLACQDLLGYRCDMALAGGASLNPAPRRGYRYVRDGHLSPSGRCRAFDAEADGMVPGDGVGVVVLRRLSDALADGDHVHAVIRATAINNDGRRKVGYAAPSVVGQAEVIATAHALAGVDPESITYVEAHGTGTAVGDPIEVSALKRAFAGTSERHRCALGAAKANIGHTDAAAGVAGLIKAALALEHRVLPPSPNFRAPNPLLELDRGPFYVNDRRAAWEGDGPLRAGVSSFGIGGTNAHAVLEQPPPAPGPGAAEPWSALVLSAKTPEALRAASAELGAHLAAHPELDLADVAHTLQVGRKAHRHRRSLVCRDTAEAARALADDPVGAVHVADESAPPVVFMFPGGGAQYDGMGRELYGAEPVFRDAIDRCAEVLRPVLGRDLRELLYPVGAPGGDRLSAAHATFPALLATEYAMATWLISRGVRPAAMIGHSLGEYAAACVAGVLSLEDVLPLVVARERLFVRAGGATLGVALGAEEVAGLLTGTLSVAAVNGPVSCTVSGAVEDVAALERRLAADGVEHHRMRIPAAVHSALLEPVLGEYADRLAAIGLSEPTIPFASNVSGDWIAPGEAADPAYWVRHTRSAVRFADGLRTLCRDRRPVLLEVGPGRSLSRLAAGLPELSGPVVATMRHPSAGRSDVAVLLDAVGQLWRHGVPVDWRAHHAGRSRRRVPLPGYAFQRRRYWLEPPAGRSGAVEPTTRLSAAPWSTAGAEPTGEPTGLGDAYLVVDGLADPGFRFARHLAALGARRLVVTDPPRARSPIAPAVVAPDAVRAAERRLRERNPVDRMPAGLAAELDRLSVHHVCDYLREHGIRLEPGSAHRRQEIAAALGLLPKYERFLDAFLRMLAEDGLVELDGDAVAVLREGSRPGEAAELSAELAARHPDYRRDLELLAHTVSRFGPALRGEIDGNEAFIPGGDVDAFTTLLDDRIKTSDVSVYGPLIAELVAKLARQAAGRTLRVLEVGAGSGHLSWLVAEAVRGLGNVEYHFTDLGRSFVLAGQRRAREAGIDFMRFGVLDISREPTGDDYPPGGFDVVLAFNVLHATPDVRVSAGNARTLLAPGGVALVLEATRPRRWSTLRAGLAEGWWYFDDDVRVDSPLIGPDRWVEVLGAAGLEAVTAHPGGDGPPEPVDHALVIGRRPTADHDLATEQRRRIGLLEASGAAVSVVPSTSWLPVGLDGVVLVLTPGTTAADLDELRRATRVGGAARVLLLDGAAPTDPRLSRYAEGLVARHHLDGDDAWTYVAWRSAEGGDADGLEADALRALLTTARAPSVVVRPDVSGDGRERGAPRDPGGGSAFNERPALGTEYVVPRDELEDAVAKLWAEVLGLDRVGAHDDFFDLGGESLLAMQLVARLRDRHGADLSMRQLFDAPTVARLTALLRAAGGTSAPTVTGGNRRGRAARRTADGGLLVAGAAAPTEVGDARGTD
ncbi:beta-ketoacyl synthase N-terminal-like domain-containing protein [Saccharothrix xinjiangensis]|uniref:Beta-ketoacyl synthase N-terminal-like domain-containing protein n=1 Tax=Saccharothrix xinjiangensis TaxID=204798 RepID=A0ABV9Y442_9PSEU